MFLLLENQAQESPKLLKILFVKNNSTCTSRSIESVPLTHEHHEVMLTDHGHQYSVRIIEAISLGASGIKSKEENMHRFK